MRSRMRAAGVIAAVFAVSANRTPLAAQSKGGKVPTRQVYVSVVDRFNAPVTDLTAADFEVSENGLKREVVKAGLATSPMRIALMIDTGDGMSPALNHLRAGLRAFGDAIGPEHELMVVSLGRQVRTRLPPTTDRRKFTSTSPAGSPLVLGVVRPGLKFEMSQTRLR